MHSFRIWWQLVLADFRERTRRYSYLITLMVALFVGYLVLTGKYSFSFGPYTPAYNSHWIGTTVAIAGAAMFALMGFYIVRTSIRRDRDTRVGEILATTRLSNVSYIFAKFASNLLVLWSMVASLTTIALVGMIARVPFQQIDFVAFFLPFIFLPMVSTIPVAGAAVLFDTVRWLRGTIGNVLYFFFAEFMIVTGIFGLPYFDAVGMGLLENSIKSSIHAVYPGVKIPMAVGFVEMFDKAMPAVLSPFVWDGIDWTLPLLLSRLLWPAVAFLMVVVAVLLFDRFEQSTKVSKKKVITPEKSEQIVTPNGQPKSAPTFSYKNIPTVNASFGLLPLIMAELRLGLKEIKKVWLMIGLAIVVAQLFVPFDIIRKFFIPAAMMWPLVYWSSMGTRETRFNMRQLMFCSPKVHSRQYFAVLLSGIGIALIMCMPMLVRALVTGEFVYLLVLISAAFLLPTTAFALGVVSGSRKLFEVCYLMIWYVGSLDHVAPVDLLGTSEASTSMERATVFLLITLVAGLVAYVGRRQRSEI